MNLWEPTNSRAAASALERHYSRRHPLRRGARLGGIGEPLYLLSACGSVWVSVWQTKTHWDIPWRTYPSWWGGAFRRAPDDATASALITAAISLQHARHPGPTYTTIDLRHVKRHAPGRTYIIAGFRPHVSTRPRQQCRSLLVMLHDPKRPT